MLSTHLTLADPRRARGKGLSYTLLLTLATYGLGCASGPSADESTERSRGSTPDGVAQQGTGDDGAPLPNGGGTPDGVDVGTIRFGPGPVGGSAHEPLAGYPTGERQRQILCARPGKNPIKDVFCAAERPTIRSLTDLQRALDLDFRADPPPPPTDGGVPPPPPADVDPTQVNTNGRVNPQFALNAHSTSLVTRYTSSINPRAVIFRQTGRNFIAMGFVRGEQFVELITRERSGNLAFFLVQFRQACNDAPSGCTPGDLYTPQVERDWTSYSVYGGEDVRNNVMDCAQCHQPGGPGTRAILRMQEQQFPWTHWMRVASVGGLALIGDYTNAKGDESFAGIPGSMLNRSDPLLLQLLLAFQGFAAQPNEFPTGAIENEVANSAFGQPFLNNTPGKSATWDALYAKNVAGETIQVPYHDVKVTDPAKLATVSRAYARFRTGALPKEQVPDLSDVFSSDRKVLAEIGFAPQPGLDGAGLIQQLCTQCHNDKLDQSVSRARFSTDLSKMSREEKDIAIQRLMLADDDVRAMPPRRFRTVTEEERTKMVELLRQ